MFDHIKKTEEERSERILAAYGIEKGGRVVREGIRGGHIIGHRRNGDPIYASNVKSVNDAKKILADVEAGKDRGHMEAKVGRGSAIPNSSSGHSIEDEKDAHYVIHGNKFLDHPYEKVKQEFPAITIEQYNAKKEEASKRYSHLVKIRQQYKSKA